jgi:hypothetical protein
VVKAEVTAMVAAVVVKVEVAVAAVADYHK